MPRWRSRCACSAGCARRRSRAPFCCPTRRWHSAWCVPRRRFARQHPVRRTAERAAAGAPRCRAAGCLPDLQRGLSATSGATIVRRELASRRSGWRASWSCSCPTSPSRSGCWRCSFSRTLRRDARQSASGELVLLADQDRSRWDAGRIDEGLAILDRAACPGCSRPLSAPGRDRRGPRPGNCGRRNRLGADRAALRQAVGGVRVSSRGSQSRRGRLHGKWPGGGPGHRRRARREWRSRRLLPAPFDAGRASAALGRRAEAADEYGTAAALASNAAERQFLERRRAQLID